MSEGLRFVPPRVAFVDPRSGMITREWYLFLQGVFTRIGGATGESTTDIVASLFEDAGSSETNAMLFELEQSVSQVPASQVLVMDTMQAEISELRDTVSELRKELDAIRQGPSI